jgi:hypothetical protein
MKQMSCLVAISLLLVAAGCNRGRGETLPLVTAQPPAEPRPIPAEVAPPLVEFFHLAPEAFTQIPRWEAAQWGREMPETTWNPAHQSTEPFRWDLARIDDQGRAQPGRERYSVYHGHGCCGGCQAVALLGAVLTQHRIDTRQPIRAKGTVPHYAALPLSRDELDLRSLLATSRQAYLMGGRDIPTITPALAVVGAPTKDDLRPLLEGAGDPWTPARFCQAVMGRRLPVIRARTREFDVRFMTVALREGPVVISGAFNRLRRDDDGIYRCPDEAQDLSRHHFMLVIGWELNDRDLDGLPDEVVWLARDDNERSGDDQDNTWSDAFLDDEWARMVPRGCLLDHWRAHSIIPGTAARGSFDDPILAGPEGSRVSFCEYDPDADGVATARDLCPFYPDPDQTDRDGDGIGDACDPCPEAPPLERPERGHRDEDGDGRADACDPCPNDPDLDCQPE